MDYCTRLLIGRLWVQFPGGPPVFEESMKLTDAVKISKVERVLDAKPDSMGQGARLEYAPGKFLYAYTCSPMNSALPHYNTPHYKDVVNIPSHHITFNPYSLAELSSFPDSVKQLLNDEGWEPF
jgi:hypothetical protein